MNKLKIEGGLNKYFITNNHTLIEDLESTKA